MRKTRFLFLSVIFALIVVSSCKKEDPVVEAEELVNYVESVVDIGSLASYITAEQLLTKINAQQAPYIVDVRGSGDYTTGHIPGAVNVALGSLLTDVEANVSSMTDEIVVVCYTGQSAAFGTSLLKLAGYTNAKSLKFGMTSWHSDFDSWSGNESTYYYTFLETTSNTKPDAGDLPTVNTGFENGEDILDARIDAMFSAGFTPYAIGATTVTNNPDNYYIVNYWPNAEYLDPGHIPGAYNYVPGQSLTQATDLETLPTDKTIVVYCYTGQTSAFIAAYLGTLGYEVKSLKFGANSMFHGNLPSSNWSIANIMDYAYE